MCGFAGQIDLQGLAGSPERRMLWLRVMGQQLARRGPDDEQFYDDGYLALVFRRLSIVDLAGGRQPIWNEDHSVLATVNGEIYNHEDIRNRLRDRHVFATRSDSEAIVHLYEERGASLMHDLNGMFAFLVWDTRNRRLLLARDRLGIKPLFFVTVGSSLIFASELKALLAHPDCPRDLDWLDFNHAYALKQGLPTYIRNVQQLAGGHYLSVEDGKSRLPRPYWSLRDHLPTPESASGRDAQYYITEYGELLHDSVHKRLMSDVPIGLFLSGGIDSTLLAALAADAKQELHCFTVVEDNTIEAGDVEQAEKASAELGLAYYPVRYDYRTMVDELDYTLEQFEFLIWALETPRFSLEWLLKQELHRYARTRMPGLKVMLLGQGADEFAGGYSQSMGRENQSWTSYRARLAQSHLQTRRLDSGIPDFMHPALADDFPPDRETPHLSDFQREMLERTRVLQNYNLWHEDRTSSCHGIEARVPFLDHRLVELLASVPRELHETLFFDKRIVREQLARSLPSYPRDKLKVRFYVTGRRHSITRLRTEIIRRIFPAFKKKYLDQPDAIFSAQKMTASYNLLINGRQTKEDDLLDFFDCMAISIFDRFRDGIPTMGLTKTVDPPSPLQVWRGQQATP